MKNGLNELDERLSAVYHELHLIKTEMEKIYEAEEHRLMTVKLGLILMDITSVQQEIEDEQKD